MIKNFDEDDEPLYEDMSCDEDPETEVTNNFDEDDLDEDSYEIKNFSHKEQRKEQNKKKKNKTETMFDMMLMNSNSKKKKKLIR